jgi:hypothetical protein
MEKLGSHETDEELEFHGDQAEQLDLHTEKFKSRTLDRNKKS